MEIPKWFCNKKGTKHNKVKGVIDCLLTPWRRHAMAITSQLTPRKQTQSGEQHEDQITPALNEDVGDDHPQLFNFPLLLCRQS